MSRFVSKGRNSWTPRVARYRPHFDGPLHPADVPTASTAWSLIAVVFAVAVFAGHFISWSAQ